MRSPATGAEPPALGFPAVGVRVLLRPEGSIVVGVTADTHGIVRPSLLALLDGVDTILHAGDVCGEHVLAALRELAPVIAVRGNNDPVGLPERLEVELGGRRIGLAHGDRFPLRNRRLALANSFPGAEVVVYGHTHRPAEERVGTTLVVNPGASGRRRFGTPAAATAGILTLEPRGIRWRLHPLE